MSWQESWEDIRLLGKGGQGSARLVKNKVTQSQGVLKTLRPSNAKDLKARGRMQREIANLSTLAAMDVKVPAVVESNIEQVADLSVDLYFVMDYIEGPTLEQYIQGKDLGRVEWDEALRITRLIADTIDAGHQEGIQHRDLKPKNIIMAVVADEPMPFVVDYGLSYYHGVDDDLTACNETIWNEFLTLPETNIDGEDRRDARSDVSAVGAIAYFCTTGASPGHLINSQNRLPHRRDSRDFSVVTADPVALAQLNNTFDRVFSPDLNRRYQTCPELIDALAPIGTALTNSDIDDVEAVARQASDLLRATVRDVQIRTLKAEAKPRYAALTKQIIDFKPKLDLFTLDRGYATESMTGPPDGDDDLGMTYGVTLTSKIGKLEARKSYVVSARGMDIVLSTREQNVGAKMGEPMPPKDLEVVAGEGTFSKALVELELKRWLSAQILKMQTVLLEKANKSTGETDKDTLLKKLRRHGGY